MATITGTSANNTLYGTTVNDQIDALGGNDNVFAGGGDDTVFGRAGSDYLQGDAGNDTVIGNAGQDLLYGSTGNNTLRGGGGRDFLNSFHGADRFDFDNASDSLPGIANSDSIIHFTTQANSSPYSLADKIDLAGIDANTGVTGNQAFRFVGMEPVDAPGEVGYLYVNDRVVDDETGEPVTSTLIRGNTDADLAPEFEIHIDNYLTTLAATDFIV
jgi:Ca2+-binding RTX toxin-like protein